MPKKQQEPPPSYADQLTAAGVGLIAAGLAGAWLPLCPIWLGAAAIAAGVIRARNRAHAMRDKRKGPADDRPAV